MQSTLEDIDNAIDELRRGREGFKQIRKSLSLRKGADEKRKTSSEPFPREWGSRRTKSWDYFKENPGRNSRPLSFSETAPTSLSYKYPNQRQTFASLSGRSRGLERTRYDYEHSLAKNRAGGNRYPNIGLNYDMLGSQSQPRSSEQQHEGGQNGIEKDPVLLKQLEELRAEVQTVREGQDRLAKSTNDLSVNMKPLPANAFQKPQIDVQRLLEEFQSQSNLSDEIEGLKSEVSRLKQQNANPVLAEDSYIDRKSVKSIVDEYSQAPAPRHRLGESSKVRVIDCVTGNTFYEHDQNMSPVKRSQSLTPSRKSNSATVNLLDKIGEIDSTVKEKELLLQKQVRQTQELGAQFAEVLQKNSKLLEEVGNLRMDNTHASTKIQEQAAELQKLRDAWKGKDEETKTQIERLQSQLSTALDIYSAQIQHVDEQATLPVWKDDSIVKQKPRRRSKLIPSGAKIIPSMLSISKKKKDEKPSIKIPLETQDVEDDEEDFEAEDSQMASNIVSRLAKARKTMMEKESLSEEKLNKSRKLSADLKQLMNDNQELEKLVGEQREQHKKEELILESKTVEVMKQLELAYKEFAAFSEKSNDETNVEPKKKNKAMEISRFRQDVEDVEMQVNALQIQLDNDRQLLSAHMNTIEEQASGLKVRYETAREERFNAEQRYRTMQSNMSDVKGLLDEKKSQVLEKEKKLQEFERRTEEKLLKVRDFTSQQLTYSSQKTMFEAKSQEISGYIMDDKAKLEALKKEKSALETTLREKKRKLENVLYRLRRAKKEQEQHQRDLQSLQNSLMKAIQSEKISKSSVDALTYKIEQMDLRKKCCIQEHSSLSEDIQKCEADIKNFNQRIEKAQRVRLASEKAISVASFQLRNQESISLNSAGVLSMRNKIEEEINKFEIEMSKCKSEIELLESEINLKSQAKREVSYDLEFAKQKLLESQRYVHNLKQRLISQKKEFKAQLEREAQVLEAKNTESSLAWSKLEQALGA